MRNLVIIASFILILSCKSTYEETLKSRDVEKKEELAFKLYEKEDFFTDGDPELYALQEAQHNILHGMISEEGLLEKFANPNNRQSEPLLLDENGFVINGNRRLCCWRTL